MTCPFKDNFCKRTDVSQEHVLERRCRGDYYLECKAYQDINLCLREFYQQNVNNQFYRSQEKKEC